jgi:hypothetical protein
MKNPLNSQGRHRAAADGSSAAVDDLPLPGYDRLNVSQIIARLPRVSQVELTAVDHYERAHANRIDVLNKLRYLRGPEPVDGYDVLGPEEIVGRASTGRQPDAQARARIRAEVPPAATPCCAPSPTSATTASPRLRTARIGAKNRDAGTKGPTTAPASVRMGSTGLGSVAFHRTAMAARSGSGRPPRR